jgi:hypothetical protein
MGGVDHGASAGDADMNETDSDDSGSIDSNRSEGHWDRNEKKGNTPDYESQSNASIRRHIKKALIDVANVGEARPVGGGHGLMRTRGSNENSEGIPT